MTNDIADTNPEDSVPCFALSKNDSYVMSASGGKISLFNMMTFKVTQESNVVKSLLSFFILPISISFWQLQTMTTFMPPPPAATFLAFHPQDNNIIAIGMDDSTIQIYNVRVDEVWCSMLTINTSHGLRCHFLLSTFLMQVKSKLKGHSKRITGLAFSHVLNVLVSSGADAQVTIFLFRCVQV